MEIKNTVEILAMVNDAIISIQKVLNGQEMLTPLSYN
jgi:hypothetical protein